MGWRGGGFEKVYHHNIIRSRVPAHPNKVRVGRLLSMHSVGTYQEKELACNSLGNTQPLSSQLTQPLWIDPNLKKVELV